jgi:type IX secretion system PorP/SprF family membrane protein
MKERKLKLRVLGLLSLFVSLFNGINAQDPQFSQFYNTSLYYNPASAGLFQDLRISSSYRNIWSNIPGDISTYFFSIDYQWTKKNIGLGLLMLSDNEGLNNLRTQRFELIYSYRIQSKYRLLQFGMSVFSINIRDLKNKDFVFVDQLDPVNGIVQESSFIHDKIEPKVYPDWNAGLIYMQTSRRHNFTQTYGFSASHIFTPNISLLNDKVNLPVKYVFHANFITQIVIHNNDIWKRKYAFIKPGFIYEYQNPLHTFTIGSGFDIYPIRLGTWFRNQSVTNKFNFNSVIVLIGVVVPIYLNHNIIIDYTYDSTISKLEFASGGAHEITVTYNISLPDKKRAMPCFNEWWRAKAGFAHYSK